MFLAMINGPFQAPCASVVSLCSRRHILPNWAAFAQTRLDLIVDALLRPLFEPMKTVSGLELKVQEFSQGNDHACN